MAKTHPHIESPKILAAILASALLAGCAATTAPAPVRTLESSPTAQAPSAATLPDGFVHLSETAPGVEVELRYATDDNFTGSVVDGYRSTDAAILREHAAEALGAVQRELEQQGLGLLVWDAFRPTRAVDYFVEWARNPDDSTQAEYYPGLEKAQLFELGYIAEHSRHSLGGTVDLTLIRLADGEALDMGGAFDFFGERSHYDAAGLTEEQRQNRALLRTAMELQGFEPYPLEWWHFSYPLPESTEPSDFPVE